MGGGRPDALLSKRRRRRPTPRTTIKAVEVRPGQAFSAELPRTIIQLPYDADAYGVAPDGKRFLVLKQTAATTAIERLPIEVVLNWTEGLDRLAPPR